MLTIGQRVKIQPDTDFNIWHVGVITFIGYEAEVGYIDLSGKQRFFGFAASGFEHDEQVIATARKWAEFDWTNGRTNRNPYKKLSGQWNQYENWFLNAKLREENHE